VVVKHLCVDAKHQEVLAKKVFYKINIRWYESHRYTTVLHDVNTPLSMDRACVR